MALAQSPYGDLPGGDPGATEIEALVGAGEGPEIAAPADALAPLQDVDAQAARAEITGRGGARETGADDQHIAAFLGHARISSRPDTYPAA